MTEPEGARTTAKAGGGPGGLVLPLLNLGALSLLFGLSISWWGRLPVEPAAPGHDGGPGVIQWFALPLVGAVTGLFFLGLRVFKGLSARHPWIVSIPRRNLFLSLPDEGRRRVLERTFRLLGLFPLPAYGYLLYGQWVNFRVALEGGAPLPRAAVGAFLVASLGVILVYLAAVGAAVAREARAAGLGGPAR